MMQESRVWTGKHFLQGNEALAEGALAAGCLFASGYPITPATEITHALARRLPQVGGTYLQMEDELGAVASAIGASWTGKKVMVATSGPGISLMLENIGYALGVETPLVVVNVQRGGPTTGIPSIELQGDMIQPKFGSHGEYEILALAPASPQEMFDLAVRAFNMAEKYRTPVFVLADAFIGHMREEVVIPREEEILLVTRKLAAEGLYASQFKGFLDPEVAPMPIFGRGHRAHVTSSCHDEWGRRNVTDASALDRFIRGLREKILRHLSDIIDVEVQHEDAQVMLFACGSVSRSARHAMTRARQEGLDVGLIRPLTVWPFPSEEVRRATRRARAVVVLENNMGQLVHFVLASMTDSSRVTFLPPQILGTLHRVDYVLDAIRKAVP
ncbi:MAG: 2-oxoacid:acceptor oxidoreductase subunit alpha [Deltaproteobacteria bacterium]|nr:2-oxoacid:acceptor oxidoreductase subunit alpha [Deltaproteobacteria bacterium]